LLPRTTIGPLEVSAIQLGIMMFGSAVAEPRARSLMDAFVDASGDFMDTSNNYAFWHVNGHAGGSEELLGRWLKDRGRRDDLKIATKVGALPNRVGAGFEDIQGLGRKTIVRSVEDSLRRIGTDYIDLYYAHIDDRTTPLEETLAGFDDIVRAGKVRAIGCSNTLSWRIESARRISRAAGWPEYCCVQQRHTYLKVHPRAHFPISDELGEVGGIGIGEGTTNEHLDYARANPDFRIVAYSPMLVGAYADPSRISANYKSAENEERLQVLERVAEETGASTGQIVLAWIMQSSPQIIPLMAVSSAAQLEENLGGASLRLSAEQLAKLETAA
jgi:aryl-alcohol dehydrogenase-like predicted oxidoreductase